MLDKIMLNFKLETGGKQDLTKHAVLKPVLIY